MADILKIAIISGEPSGDFLAAGLMANLIQLSGKPIKFFGIGGDKMANYGLESAYDMSILSIGGYGFDVIRAIPKILYIRHKIIRQIIDFGPDVFIGVDAPDFNFYIEKTKKWLDLKKKGLSLPANSALYDHFRGDKKKKDFCHYCSPRCGENNTYRKVIAIWGRYSNGRRCKIE